MLLSAFEPRSQNQRHFSPFVLGLNELNEPSPGTVTKPASKNSRLPGSKSGKASAFSSKKREALIKLELSCPQKTHNKERIREEQEIERLRHLKLIADGQRRVEAAELEAAVYYFDATKNEPSRLIQVMTTCRMLGNTRTTFLKMDPLPLSSPNFHIFLPPKPPLSLELSRHLIQRVTWLLLSLKAQTSVRFATQPFQGSWQEGVACHGFHRNPVVSATIDAAPSTQFCEKIKLISTLCKLT